MRDQFGNDDDELAAVQNNLAPYQPSQVGPLESFLRGGAQQATLGFGDEASAALGAMAPTETDQSLNRGYGDRYAQIRDYIRNQNQSAQQTNPNAYLGGQIAGGLTTASALPMAGAQYGLGGLGATLAGYGAVQGAGDATEGERIPGAIEGAKSALTAPYDLAKYASQSLGQGEFGDAAKGGGLMALSLMPFVLHGKPINEFVQKKYVADLDRLQAEINAAKQSGSEDAMASVGRKINDQGRDLLEAHSEWAPSKNEDPLNPGNESFPADRWRQRILEMGKENGANRADLMNAAQEESRQAHNQRTIDLHKSIESVGLKRDEVRNLLGMGDGQYNEDHPWAPLNDYVYDRFKNEPDLDPKDLAKEIKEQNYGSTPEVTSYREFGNRREAQKAGKASENEKIAAEESRAMESARANDYSDIEEHLKNGNDLTQGQLSRIENRIDEINSILENHDELPEDVSSNLEGEIYRAKSILDNSIGRAQARESGRPSIQERKQRTVVPFSELQNLINAKKPRKLVSTGEDWFKKE